MARVHYKGSSTFCCSSDAPCEEMRKSNAADPAQSANTFYDIDTMQFGRLKRILTGKLESYAALRTAQLEERFSKTRLSELRLKTRAETAESALRDARELLSEAQDEIHSEFCTSKHHNSNSVCSKIENWLTVAAQTPEEKS